jgi:hypothetical protein
MKRIVFAAACCLAAVVSVSAHAAPAGAPPCTPKITTIQGHRAGVNCGPATVTLHLSGKTYTFHDGFCERSKSAGSALELSLGTIVIGVKGNAGRPNLNMLIGARLHSAYGDGSVFQAYYGGSKILGDSLIKAGGNIPSKGTFTSTVAVGAKFTGSWDCHGVVWTKP